MASLDSATDSLPSLGDIKVQTVDEVNSPTAQLTRNVSLGRNPSELWSVAFAECRNDVVLLLKRFGIVLC